LQKYFELMRSVAGVEDHRGRLFFSAAHSAWMGSAALQLFAAKAESSLEVDAISKSERGAVLARAEGKSRARGDGANGGEREDLTRLGSESGLLSELSRCSTDQLVERARKLIEMAEKHSSSFATTNSESENSGARKGEEVEWTAEELMHDASAAEKGLGQGEVPDWGILEVERTFPR
jgi:hypothetical protein